MTNQAIEAGTSYGPELLIRLRGGRRRAQLEDRLRELVRDGTLPAGSRLPSSRALAGDLDVSRRLVVDAYAQLLAEGYLLARQGAGTYVASTAGLADGVDSESPAQRPRFDFFPGAPDLASFPRALWSRALRDVLRSAPSSAFAYPDPRGAPELRRALASYLRRVRGVVAEPSSIVVCAGATQGLALLGRALARQGTDAIAVEDPGLPPHRAVLAYAGLQVRGARVDEQGLDVAAVDAPVRADDAGASVPDGRRALAGAPRRAGRLGASRGAGDRGRLRRRVPLRPRAARRAAGPGARPRHLPRHHLEDARAGAAARLAGVARVAVRRRRAKRRCSMTSARPRSSSWRWRGCSRPAAYDRHLRKARRRNRDRRDALIAAVARHLPDASISGISAGLHALVRLPRVVNVQALLARAAEHSVGVYPLALHMIDPQDDSDSLVMGYANLSEPSIAEGVRRLAEALDGL